MLVCYIILYFGTVDQNKCAEWHPLVVHVSLDTGGCLFALIGLRLQTRQFVQTKSFSIGMKMSESLQINVIRFDWMGVKEW